MENRIFLLFVTLLFKCIFLPEIVIGQSKIIALDAYSGDTIDLYIPKGGELKLKLTKKSSEEQYIKIPQLDTLIKLDDANGYLSTPSLVDYVEIKLEKEITINSKHKNFAPSTTPVISQIVLYSEKDKKSSKVSVPIKLSLFRLNINDYSPPNSGDESLGYLNYSIDSPGDVKIDKIIHNREDKYEVSFYTKNKLKITNRDHLSVDSKGEIIVEKIIFDNGSVLEINKRYSIPKVEPENVPKIDDRWNVFFIFTSAIAFLCIVFLFFTFWQLKRIGINLLNIFHKKTIGALEARIKDPSRLDALDIKNALDASTGRELQSYSNENEPKDATTIINDFLFSYASKLKEALKVDSTFDFNKIIDLSVEKLKSLDELKKQLEETKKQDLENLKQSLEEIKKQDLENLKQSLEETKKQDLENLKQSLEETKKQDLENLKQSLEETKKQDLENLKQSLEETKKQDLENLKQSLEETKKQDLENLKQSLEETKKQDLENLKQSLEETKKQDLENLKQSLEETKKQDLENLKQSLEETKKQDLENLKQSLEETKKQDLENLKQSLEETKKQDLENLKQSLEETKKQDLENLKQSLEETKKQDLENLKQSLEETKKQDLENLKQSLEETKKQDLENLKQSLEETKKQDLENLKQSLEETKKQDLENLKQSLEETKKQDLENLKQSLEETKKQDLENLKQKEENFLKNKLIKISILKKPVPTEDIEELKIWLEEKVEFYSPLDQPEYLRVNPFEDAERIYADFQIAARKRWLESQKISYPDSVVDLGKVAESLYHLQEKVEIILEKRRLGSPFEPLCQMLEASGNKYIAHASKLLNDRERFASRLDMTPAEIDRINLEQFHDKFLDNYLIVGLDPLHRLFAYSHIIGLGKEEFSVIKAAFIDYDLDVNLLQSSFTTFRQDLQSYLHVELLIPELFTEHFDTKYHEFSVSYVLMELSQNFRALRESVPKSSIYDFKHIGIKSSILKRHKKPVVMHIS